MREGHHEPGGIMNLLCVFICNTSEPQHCKNFEQLEVLTKQLCQHAWEFRSILSMWPLWTGFSFKKFPKRAFQHIENMMWYYDLRASYLSLCSEISFPKYIFGFLMSTTINWCQTWNFVVASNIFLTWNLEITQILNILLIVLKLVAFAHFSIMV